MPHASDWPTPIWVTDPARTRAHMAAVLKAFGPMEAIVDYVGPAWGTVSEPDLFDQPTRTEAVSRYIEQRIKAAGVLYYRTLKFPSVAETRNLLQDLEVKLVAVARTMQHLLHARNAFNAAHGLTEIDAADVPEHDPWENLSVAIEDGLERLAFLKRPNVSVSDLLEQPPTNRKEPERVLWETIFALLRECGIEPLEKYQPVIHTLRAAHQLFGIDKLPNAGSVGYVKSEFLKQQDSSSAKQTLD
jgi:hypothetical protein